MSELVQSEIAADSILTPGTDTVTQYVDSVHKTVKHKDDAGRISGQYNNLLTSASQSPAASTRTYLVGSSIPVPKSLLRVGTRFRWRFSLTKTGAGTATSTVDIAVGTAGTTADTARVSFTKPAGTAAADEAWFEIDAVVKSIGASGVMAGTMRMIHNLASTGHAQIPCVVVTTVSAGFDMTVADLIVGLCLTPGASDSVTVTVCTGEVINL